MIKNDQTNYRGGMNQFQNPVAWRRNKLKEPTTRGYTKSISQENYT